MYKTYIDVCYIYVCQVISVYTINVKIVIDAKNLPVCTSLIEVLY